MELEPFKWKYKKMIVLHNFLYVTGIANTLYSIINHDHQPDCSLVIENGATTVEFPTFILLAKTNKDISLDSDLPLKDRHSQPEYTNLPNEFKNTAVRLIHDKVPIPARSTEDYAIYDLHSVEYVSIKPGKTKILTPA